MRGSPGYPGRSIGVVGVSEKAVQAKRWLAVLFVGLVCGWSLLGCGGAGTEAGSAPPAPVVTAGPPAPTATSSVIVPGERVPHITLSELTYDFGDIPPTAPVEHTFTFTNTGTANLVIERVGAS